MKQTFIILIISLLLVSCLSFNLDTKNFLSKQKIFSNVVNSQNNPSGQFEGQYNIKSKKNDGSVSVSGTLEYSGPLNTFLSDTNDVIKELNFKIQFDNNNELTWSITPAGKPFFSLPQKEPFPYEKGNVSGTDNSVYTIGLPNIGERFEFCIFNLQGVVVFDSHGQNFVFTEQYVAFGTQVYSELIWGWGQQRGVWEYDSGSYTIWNYDNPTNMNQKQPGQQTYGTHPVILQKSNGNNAQQQVNTQYFMTYIRTSYGLQMDYEKNNSINIQMSGGPIEIKFFIYSSPKENIAAYSKYVNGWALHPFWSMGFHLCRWGLENTEQWSQIWKDAIQNDIAFDTLWSDIDYMQNYEDFTISEKYNVEIMKTVTDLNTNNGVHWIPIIDAGVGYVGDSGLTGQKEGLFIQSAKTNESLIGCVWPGPAYFVDFNHPNAKQFWVNGLNNITEVYNAPRPSGIWLDMNDPSSFTDSNGEVTNPDDCVPLDDGKSNKQQEENKSKLSELYEYFAQKLDFTRENEEIKNSSNDDWGYPWSPMGDLPLQFKTISTDAIHYNEKDAQYVNIDGFQITELEFHDLYAFLEQIATREYLEQQDALPFIITRSSFAGSGRYTQLWTGDNYASWDQMETSLGDIFNFQIFQIPMAGPDVCGFSGGADPQMCARWYQLGAFYPFFRSHNDNVSADQFPWSFPDQPYVLQSSRASINLRYSLLKQYYSIFVKEQPHGTVFKPLFFEYPEDENAQVEAHQALIGSNIMITPILVPGNDETQITDIKVYFPGSNAVRWYRYQDDAEFQVAIGGDVSDFQVAYDETCPMFLKSGTAIFQQTQYLKPQSSLRSRFLDNEFDLVIALDKDGNAQGEMLSVENFSDQQAVKSQCMGFERDENNQIIYNNCLWQLSVETYQQQRLSLTMAPLERSGAQQKTQDLPEIKINTVRILNQGITRQAGIVFDQNNLNYIISIA